MASLRIVLLSAVWLGCAFAQISFSPRGVQPTSTAKHEITGVVVSASTGEPVRKALVSLQPDNGLNSSFSDGAGHFSLPDVPEGSYQLQCQKPGFYGPGIGTPFQQVRVSASNEAITVTLTPAASVSGRVVDDKDQPVEGASVQLISENVTNGHKQWLMDQSGTADEDGNYEIDNVQPGTYRLRLNMHPAPPAATVVQTQRSRLPLEVYPAQYFPQASDSSGAQALELQGGQTERADFSVTAVPGFRLRGVAAPSKPGTVIRVEDINGNDVGLGTRTNGQSGRFIVNGIPAGTWRLAGQSFGSQETLWGEQTVEVNGSDVTNLALSLEALLDIPIEISGGPEGGNPNLQLRLVRDGDGVDGGGPRNQIEYGSIGTNQPGEANKAPALHFGNVFPGHYRLRAQMYGPGNCIESIRFGSADAERDGVSVSPGQSSQPIQIALRTDCASVQVKVNLPEGVQNASVLVLSDHPSFELPVMEVAGSSTVQFPGLTPGQYRLYAFDNVKNLEYANPEVLNGFQAQEITLDPNQKAQVTLDVVKRNADGSAANGAR